MVILTLLILFPGYLIRGTKEACEIHTGDDMVNALKELFSGMGILHQTKAFNDISYVGNLKRTSTEAVHGCVD